MLRFPLFSRIPLHVCLLVPVLLWLLLQISLAGFSRNVPALSGRKDEDSLRLGNEQIRIVWAHTARGWEITRVQIRAGGAGRVAGAVGNGGVGGDWQNAGIPSGEYTLLYATERPSTTHQETFRTVTGMPFPDTVYKYQIHIWDEATSPVAMNTAGQTIYFYPESGKVTGVKATRGKTTTSSSLRFTQETEVATITTEWSLDPEYPTDIKIRHKLVPKKAGYFSLASPSLVSVAEKDLAWATVPGYFQGNTVNPNFVLAYAYGQGIPERPVIFRERCASTLSPIISSKEGVSLSVIPDPGLGRNPWAKDHYTHQDWLIGLSHMNRRAQLSPTVYYPVLGEPSSALKPGQTVSYGFRYSLQNGDWFQSLHHTVNDIYQFRTTLDLRHNRQSLSNRMNGMLNYLADSRTALWRVEEYKGMKIGAQSYLGGVVGSNHDAMKNSDYGAMWMVASMTGNPWFRDSILPYALNFKLQQQQTDTGFFQGAAIGQYYLSKTKKFVEEWGTFVEPISLTYYTMLDLGNVLLFEPDNAPLKERLRLGAESLLRWQKQDGSWNVAYDRHSLQPLFTDLQDLRPTFYGLLVAYRILKDQKYLDAAKKGADWFITNGIDQGHLIGVCGDARYAPDFATAQSAQTLLDLFDLTGEPRYREAAIRAAKIYTASIYTQPVASSEPRTVKGVPRQDWEISQSGLSFEHGGIIGSANGGGPIQLCSHAGLFIRMFRITGDSLFADMARAAAIGRDAFVDSATSVASYYWNAMNKGAGPYPHHAWWQIGWITDYLLAEAELRSGGKIVFPRGFVTPKVGPHQTYGFAPGSIYGDRADLLEREGLVGQDNPDVEVVTALATDKHRLYILLLNDRKEIMKTEVKLDMSKLEAGKRLRVVKISRVDQPDVKDPKSPKGGRGEGNGASERTGVNGSGGLQVTLKGYGLNIWAVDFE
ncbi:glycerophosphoryl diester phosphodiesterase [Flavitalea flava]